MTAVFTLGHFIYELGDLYKKFLDLIRCESVLWSISEIMEKIHNLNQKTSFRDEPHIIERALPIAFTRLERIDYIRKELIMISTFLPFIYHFSPSETIIIKKELVALEWLLDQYTFVQNDIPQDEQIIERDFSRRKYTHPRKRTVPPAIGTLLEESRIKTMKYLNDIYREHKQIVYSD
jgi:hypothetical protein